MYIMWVILCLFSTLSCREAIYTFPLFLLIYIIYDYETKNRIEGNVDVFAICSTGRSCRAAKRSLSYSAGVAPASSYRKKKAWMSSVDGEVVDGSSDEESNPTHLSLSGNN